MLFRARSMFAAVVLAMGAACSGTGTPSTTGPTAGGGGNTSAAGAGGAPLGGQSGQDAGGGAGGASGAGGAGGAMVPNGGSGGAGGDAGPPPSTDGVPSSLVGKKGLWDLPGLLRIRAQASSGPLKPAYDQAVAQGDAALTVGPFSVMNKTTTPPSGDKHDYMGLARYFWPNPGTPTGLPYVSRDGLSNPDVDSDKYDYRSMLTMSGSVGSLGLAYFLTRDEKYAQKAHELLNAWYIDPATRMNPNLNFAQSVPGLFAGRKDGIIDTVQMTNMIDGLEMLRDSPAFTTAEFGAITTWFTSFLDWLRTSAFGRAEESSANNHGSWYDVQTMRYAIFLGNNALATQLAELAKTRRITAQINPDGSQPREIERTNSLYYSQYGLTADFGIAQLAAAVGVDLFSYQTADGRSLRKALDYLVPYADPTRVWPLPQLVVDNRRLLMGLLRRAGVAYKEPAYEQTLQMHYADVLPPNIMQLVYPQ
jgi:hypothetical protein